MATAVSATTASTGPAESDLLNGAPKFAEFQVDMRMHAQSRTRVLERLRKADAAASAGTFVLLEGAKTTCRHDTDTEMHFRQESNFAYLFGVEEADFFGGLDVASGRAYLFVPRLPAEYAVWLGVIYPTEHYLKKYQVDQVLYVDEISSLLERLQCKTILALKIATFDEAKGLEKKFAVDRERLKPELDECRLIKSDMELDLMRHNNRISSWAHVEVMKHCRPGISEYELEALFVYLTYKNGRCRFQSYGCICATGKSSSILHYPNNDKVIADGKMCLLDMGAEYHCYCTDITNSFPANGRFTEDQRNIYNIVLRANRAVMAAMKPGVDWTDMHRLAERVVCEGLRDMRLIQGDVEELLKAHVPALFFPHGLGHLLGLDTHDVGGYPKGTERINEPGIRYLRARRVLQKGMVITVEPGVYFIDANLEPALKDPAVAKYLVAENLARFRDFGGVRIEDDVIVTETGCENMTLVPRSVEEIEKIMAEARASHSRHPHSAQSHSHLHAPGHTHGQ